MNTENMNRAITESDLIRTLQGYNTRLKDLDFKIKISNEDSNALERKDDGAYVKDYSNDIETLNANIADLNARSVNGGFASNLKRVFMCGTKNDNSNYPVTTSTNIFSIFTNIKNDRIEIDNEGYIKLEKGRRWRIYTNLYSQGGTGTKIILKTKDGEILNESNFTPTGNTVYVMMPLMYETDILQSNVYIGLFLEASRYISIKASSLIVEEIGREVILDPFKTVQDHKIEYGTFFIDSDKTIAPNNVLPFDRVEGNMNLVNGLVHLTAGKTYMFTASVYNNSNTPTNQGFKIKNSDGEVITTIGVDGHSFASPIVTVDKDMDVSLAHSSSSVTISYRYTYTLLSVHEITQPTVCEYTHKHEVSNPLMSSEISQESPIGTVISYMGTTAPDHYLICDGSIYNIADYSQLAEWIKAEHGSYNYWGGDGVTTFAVPLINNTFLNYDLYDEKYSYVVPMMVENITGNFVSSSTNNVSGWDSYKAFDRNTSYNSTWASLNDTNPC